MPYVVTRLEPRQRKISILDFLNDRVTLNMMRPPTRYQTTGTRTYYYNNISPEKLEQLDIPKQILILEQFYELHKHLDICNGNEEYNYELQVEILQKLKNDGIPEDEREIKCREELESRGLKFNPLYETFFIPKHSSKPGHTKWRRIDAPCNDLKMCLTMLKEIFEVLMDGCYYHTSAFAYIHNRACKDCIQRHANNGSNWYLKLDFSNFFGSITPEFVMKMFSEVYPFSEIVKTPQGETVLRNCLNLCFLSGGLPQGTPASPLITNIMMIPIDHKLSNGLLKKKVTLENRHESGYVYTRYADDIFVSSKFNFPQNEVVDYIKSVLSYYNAPFGLNDEKTRYGSNAGENWMLGLMLNQEHKVTVGHQRKKRLKAAITNYMLDRNAGNKWALEDVQHLQGEISYCKSIEPETIEYILTQYSLKYGEDIIGAIKADIKSQAL